MTSKDHCAKRLAHDKVQQKLVDVFSFYCDDLQEILQLASTQNCGERPENLANEVFSCFHHVARGLCEGKTIEKTIDECDKAVKSHLKRATLDSYKMAINSFLHEDRQLKETLDYLVLVDDFEKYVPDGMKKVNAINDLKSEVCSKFRSAKRQEARGYPEKAIEHFNAALEASQDLSDKIREFTGNETYALACAREARERRERKKDRRNVVFAALGSSIVTAALMLGGQTLLSDGPVTSDVAPTENQSQATSPEPDRERLGAP